MVVYHGSYIAVEHPEIRKSRFPKDFGEGFYCTQLQHQAVKWANKYDSPMVSAYEFNLLSGLKVLAFEQMTDEWLDFIGACRSGKPHDYDVVMGPMADDQVYNYVSDFLSGVITREQFWVLAKFKYPTHQVCLCTPQALKCITFLSAESCPL